MIGNNYFGQLLTPYTPFVNPQMMMNHHPISGRFLATGGLNVNSTKIPSFSLIAGMNLLQRSLPIPSFPSQAELEAMKLSVLGHIQNQTQVEMPLLDLLNVRNSMPTLNVNLGSPIQNFVGMNGMGGTLRQAPQQPPLLSNPSTSPLTDTSCKVEKMLQAMRDEASPRVSSPKTETEEDDSISHVKKVLASKKIKKQNKCGHSDRPHYARGFCHRCYLKHGRTKKPWMCDHEILYAYGLCQKCYKKACRKNLLTDKVKAEIRKNQAGDSKEPIFCSKKA